MVIVDIRRFCLYCVPDFNPLGGNRVDCAVTACTAMYLCDARSVALRLPWDVLDVSLAALCAPLLINDNYTSGQLGAGHGAFDFPTVTLRIQTVDSEVLEHARNDVHYLPGEEEVEEKESENEREKETNQNSTNTHAVTCVHDNNNRSHNDRHHNNNDDDTHSSMVLNHYYHNQDDDNDSHHNNTK